jgi:hypothetical protein
MIHTLTVALILSTAGAAVPIAAGMNAAALPAELSAEALGRYLSHRSPLQQKTTEYGYSDSLVRSLKSITERSWRGRCSGMLGARDASSRVPLIGICDLVTSLSARRHGFRQEFGNDGSQHEVCPTHDRSCPPEDTSLLVDPVYH